MIRRGHPEPRDLFGFHPPELVNPPGFRDSLLDSAAKNQKEDGARILIVKNDFEEIPNLDADSQFFLQFPLEGLPGLFFIFDLSTRKFPEEAV